MTSFVLLELALLGFLLYKGLVVIRPGQRGTLERQGKFLRNLEPGTHFIIPFLDKVRVQDGPR